LQRGGKVGLFLAQPGNFLVEIHIAHSLLLEVIKVRIVSGGGEADGQAAGFVVAGDDDERFLRMLGRKVNRDLNRVGQGNGVVDAGHGVVSVAAPIDLAALGHQEEAVFVVKVANSGRHDFGQRQRIPALGRDAAAVDLILHGVVLIGIGHDGQRTAAFGVQGADVLIGVNHVEAIFCGNLIQVFLGSVAIGLVPVAAADEVQRRSG